MKLSIRVISGAGTAIVALLLAITLFYAPLISFWHQAEPLVQKDGKKMVAYVESFLHIKVYYYDYKSPFARDKHLKIVVDDGSGEMDPYRNGKEGPQVHRFETRGDTPKSSLLGRLLVASSPSMPLSCSSKLQNSFEKHS